MAPLELVEWHIIAVALCAALLGGIVRGTTGFGGPAIMMLSLTQFFSPASVMPLVLIADYAAAVQLVLGAVKKADWRFLTPLIIGTVFGLPIGIYLLESSEPELIKRAIALVAGACALLMLTGWRFKTNPRTALTVLVGLGGGAIVGATFIALPLMIFIFSAPGDAARTRANALGWGLVTNTVLIALFASRGMFDLGHLWQGLVITVAYIAGAAIGARVFKTLSEVFFRRVVLFSLLGLSMIGLIT